MLDFNTTLFKDAIEKVLDDAKKFNSCSDQLKKAKNSVEEFTIVAQNINVQLMEVAKGNQQLISVIESLSGNIKEEVISELTNDVTQTRDVLDKCGILCDNISSEYKKAIDLLKGSEEVFASQNEAVEKRISTIINNQIMEIKTANSSIISCKQIIEQYSQIFSEYEKNIIKEIKEGFKLQDIQISRCQEELQSLISKQMNCSMQNFNTIVEEINKLKISTNAIIDNEEAAKTITTNKLEAILQAINKVDSRLNIVENRIDKIEKKQLELIEMNNKKGLMGFFK